MYKRIMRAAAAAVLASCVLAGGAFARPMSPGQASAPIPAASKPGTLLKYDRIALPSNYRAKAWRILYVTRDYRMAPILSTGIVVLPDKAPKIPMDRKTVAWAHPTTGIARKCAPSLRAAPIKTVAGINELVAAGVTVAASDYPGLGTEGPMGYLVGPGQAYAVIDSVRAARQIPGVGGGTDYALYGYSQGGHAALFAADLSKAYAPELALRAVAAIAPPTDLGTLMKANLNTVPGRILTAFTLVSWSLKYGAPLAALINARASNIVFEVGRSCVDDLGGKLDALAAQKELEGRFLAQDPGQTLPWSDIIARNSKLFLRTRIPALIVQGDSDELVRPAVTRAFVQRSCREGVPLQYMVLRGKGHGGAMDAGAKPAVNWLAARLTGVPAKGNCK